jgi:hypothetical protein
MFIISQFEMKKTDSMTYATYMEAKEWQSRQKQLGSNSKNRFKLCFPFFQGLFSYLRMGQI